MNGKKDNLHIIVGFVGLLFLILDSKTALSGAVSGVGMCIQTVVPVLLPFIFLSLIITSRVAGRHYKIFRPLGKICGMPYGSESIFVSGLIGGYPIGAQSIAKAWENECINTETARRMLAFCSNAGPSFLFGVLGIVFGKHNISLILWLIQIVSAIILAALIPNKSISTCTASRVTPIGYSKALEVSVKTTGVICGWVIIFRVIYSFMSHWILRYIPEDIQILFSGILELSGGCIQLSTCQSEAIAFLMASFLLSFGGLCVFMQTRTVTGKLGTGLYLPGKILQSLISTFISCLLLPIIFPTQAVPSVWLPLLLIACIALCVVYIRKKQ